MKTIFKYAVPMNGNATFNVWMPINSTILCVQTQKNNPQIWAAVNTDAALGERRFCIVGTGHELRYDPVKYIGTFQVNDGTYVFHVFEILQGSE